MSRRPYTPRLTPEARRTQLLDAALDVLERDGYAALSIESISKEAGVTRPVVYGVFDGLEPLLHALLDRQEGRALSALLHAVPEAPSGDLDGFVRKTVHDLVALVQADPATWRPILLAPEGTPAAVRHRVDRDRELVRVRLQALVESVLPEGGLDAGIVAHGLLAIAEHFGRMLLERPDEVDADRLAATLSALVTRTRGAGPSGGPAAGGCAVITRAPPAHDQS